MNQVQHYGTGRRKTAAARVFLRPGTGEVKVNGRPLDDYFPNEVLKMVIKQPLLLTETAEKFDIAVTVLGGGSAGQERLARTGGSHMGWLDLWFSLQENDDANYRTRPP